VEADIEMTTPEEIKRKIDALLDEEYFAPIAVTRDGEPRVVVVPIVAYRTLLPVCNSDNSHT
jgi:PHD/YefM family antitoxin component YafN of YafNO toxin-antitoxin module